MHIPDLSPTTYRAEAHNGVRAVSVGWLGKQVTNRGVVPPDAIEALRYYREHDYQEDGFLGYHTCEICGRADFRGEFWIETSSTRYVLPVGIFHYIEAHGYCPPGEFLTELSVLWYDDKPI